MRVVPSLGMGDLDTLTNNFEKKTLSVVTGENEEQEQLVAMKALQQTWSPLILRGNYPGRLSNTSRSSSFLHSIMSSSSLVCGQT